MPNQPSDLKSFLAMARQNDYLILDTETSGLKRPAEIVEIAIIDSSGNILLNSLVRPKSAYGGVAAQITGITSEMLADQPFWLEVQSEVMGIIEGRNLVVYNATFDRHMFHCSDESNRLDPRNWAEAARWFCAMRAFSEFNGEWDDYHGNYAWKKLSVAVELCGGKPEGAHRAQDDCQMTNFVVKHMIDHFPENEPLDLDFDDRNFDMPDTEVPF